MMMMMMMMISCNDSQSYYDNVIPTGNLITSFVIQGARGSVVG
jgi:hypothetical protein